jgi:hypothetical protein
MVLPCTLGAMHVTVVVTGHIGPVTSVTLASPAFSGLIPPKIRSPERCNLGRRRGPSRRVAPALQRD